LTARGLIGAEAPTRKNMSTVTTKDGAAALRSAKVAKNATRKIYAGAPHGLASTHQEQLNADLLTFLET